MRSLLARLAVALVAAVLALTAARPARAQGVAIVNKTFLQRYADGKPVDPRPAGLNPQGINYSDCAANISLRVPLTLTNFADPAVSFQVWAGTQDCKTLASRTPATQQCWRVAADLARQPNPSVDVPARRILAGLADAKFRQGNDVVEPGADVCGAVDRNNVGLYVIAVRGTGTEAVAEDNVPIPVDTVGPIGLSGVELLPGNQRIHVQWNAFGDGGVEDITGVRVYCAPSTIGKAKTSVVCDDASTTPVDPVDDAGDGADAGDDGGDAADAGDGGDGGAVVLAELDAGCELVTEPAPACAAAAFEDVGEGGFDSSYDRFLCGFSAGIGNSVIATELEGQPLQNDSTYAVAVVATDSFGNTGSPSGLKCETPEETNDFWERYKLAGGEAGGGFCTTAAPGAGAGLAATLGPLLLAVVLVIRRRLG